MPKKPDYNSQIFKRLVNTHYLTSDEALDIIDGVIKEYEELTQEEIKRKKIEKEAEAVREYLYHYIRINRENPEAEPAVEVQERLLLQLYKKYHHA